MDKADKERAAVLLYRIRKLAAANALCAVETTTKLTKEKVLLLCSIEFVFDKELKGEPPWRLEPLCEIPPGDPFMLYDPPNPDDDSYGINAQLNAIQEQLDRRRRSKN